MKKLFISVISAMSLAACGGHKSEQATLPAPVSGNSPTQLNGQPTIAKAKDILSQYPTGAKILDELNGQNSYNEPIAIEIIPKAQIHAHNGHSGGGIRKGSDGKYQILAPAGLDPQDLAHVLAHELQHVKNEIEEDPYLKANPDIDAKFGKVFGAIKAGTLSQVSQTDKDVFFKSLMYTEVRAYEVNLQLEQEGLQFSTSSEIKERGLGPYVVKNYLEKNGYTLPDNVDDLVNKINSYSTLVEFQKSLQ